LNRDFLFAAKRSEFLSVGIENELLDLSISLNLWISVWD